MDDRPVNPSRNIQLNQELNPGVLLILEGRPLEELPSLIREAVGLYNIEIVIHA